MTVRHFWVEGGVVAVVFAALYAGVFADLVRAWLDSDIYRHGFLVPVVAFYLAWRRRDVLRAIPAVPSYGVGVPVVVMAGVMLLIGQAGAVALIRETSLLIMVAGLVALLFGTAWLRALALPIFYLAFMVPLLSAGTDWVHWPFQLLAANIGVGLLQLLGFPALQYAQFLDLPSVTLEVTEACSGIRFTISIVAVGIPLAYLTQSGWRRRMGLVLFGVAIGVLANGFRVALIGVWAYYGGEVLKGPMHVFQAMFVAWIGYLALFAAAWWLGREATA